MAESNMNLQEMMEKLNVLQETCNSLKEKVAQTEERVKVLQEQNEMNNNFISSISAVQSFSQVASIVEHTAQKSLKDSIKRPNFLILDPTQRKCYSYNDDYSRVNWQVMDGEVRAAIQQKEVQYNNCSVYIPVVSKNRVAGVIVAESQTGQFTETDIEKFNPDSVFANTIQLSLEKEFEHQGRIKDPLTDLYNRQGINEYVRNTLGNKDAVKEGRRSFVVMFDIDKFKNVNDTYGHDAGDTVLQNVAGMLRSNTRRGSDLAARFGGEEMVVILNNMTSAQAVDRVEQIRQQIADSEHSVCDKNGEYAKIHVSVSAGIKDIKFDKTDDITQDDVFDAYETSRGIADKYLYSAKESGRNRTCSSDEIIQSYVCGKSVNLICDKDDVNQKKSAVGAKIKSMVSEQGYQAVSDYISHEVSASNDKKLFVLFLRKQEESHSNGESKKAMRDIVPQFEETAEKQKDVSIVC